MCSDHRDLRSFPTRRSSDLYGEFLAKMGESLKLNEYESAVLSFVTKELLNGKRPHELLLLKQLLADKSLSQTEYEQVLRDYGAYVNSAVLDSVDDILTLNFFDIKQGKTDRKSVV